jgi:hypothetical protein
MKGPCFDEIQGNIELWAKMYVYTIKSLVGGRNFEIEGLMFRSQTYSQKLNRPTTMDLEC